MMKKNIRVFIVEDTLFLQEMLCRIFNEADIEVVGMAGSGGVETLSKIKNLVPDIILMDLVLPGKNGMELIRTISNTLPNTKVIVCSSLKQELFRNHSELAGALDFVKKPFSSSEIVNTIFSVAQAQVEEQVGKAA